MRVQNTTSKAYITRTVASYGIMMLVNRWTHLACTFSGNDGTLRLFLDTKQVSTSTCATCTLRAFNVSHGFAIGCNKPGTIMY